MSFCFRNGYLVDGRRPLPDDPTELQVSGLPVVGCNQLVCRKCGAVVRHALGRSFRGKHDVDIAAVYAHDDFTKSPEIGVAINDNYRLYICRCSRWLETEEHSLGEPEPDEDDPQVQWACTGHPTLAVPGSIDGAAVASQAELAALATRALHGQFPKGVRSGDKPDAIWLVRLYSRLAAADGNALVDAAIAGLEDSDATARGRAVWFFEHVHDEAGLTHVASLLDGAQLPASLEAAVWRAVGPLVARGGRAQQRARAEATKQGRGSKDLYQMLATWDGAWLSANAGDVARATPAQRDALIGSFARLPSSIDGDATRDRVRLALAAGSASAAGSLDERVAAAVKALATRLQRAPKTGAAMEIKWELPPLDAKTVLALTFRGVYPDKRFIDLAITTAGTSATGRLVEGTHAEMMTQLADPGMPSRIVALATQLASGASPSSR